MMLGKGKAVALSAMALAITVVGVFLATFRMEDLYLGDLRSLDPSRRDAAAKRLGELHSVRAVPGLIDIYCWERGLDHCRKPLHSPSCRALARILSARVRPASPALDRVFADERFGFEDVLGRIKQAGPAAREARPALLGILRCRHIFIRINGAVALAGVEPRDSDAFEALETAMAEQGGPASDAAGIALIEAGGDFPGAVRRATRSPDSGARDWAFRTLLGLGPHAAPAVPELKEGLASRDPLVPILAAVALARLGEKGELYLPALARALADPSFSFEAAEAAASLGPAARPLLPALAGALRERDVDACEWVLVALEGFGAESVLALIEAFRARSDLRRPIAPVLGAIGPPARPAVPYLVEALDDDDPDVRVGAAEALGKIGSIDGAGIAALIRCLDAEGAVLGPAAAAALGSMGGEARAAVPALAGKLRDVECQWRIAAADALGMIGPAAAPAVPSLIETFEDAGFPKLCARCAAALGRIGPGAAAAIPSLEAASVEDRSARAIWAAAALAAIDPARRKVSIEFLSRALEEGCGAASPALGLLARTDEEARKILMEWAASRSSSVGTRWVAEGLREAGMEGVPTGWLGSEDAGLRSHALEVLARLGLPAASKAIPATRKALEDPDPNVRQEAEAVLRALEDKRRRPPERLVSTEAAACFLKTAGRTIRG
jgi:HEAT repeat protein